MRNNRGVPIFHLEACLGSVRNEMALGHGLINVLKMALETAKRCEEKRADKGCFPFQALQRCRLKPFQRPEDMANLSDYSVAKV